METCSLWCPLQPLQVWQEACKSLSQLLVPSEVAHSSAPGFPGSPAPRLPGTGAGSRPHAGLNCPPARGDAGIGGGSAAFLSRALTCSRPPPRPEHSPALAVQAPHCRCLPAALRSAAPALPHRSPRPPSASRTLAAPEGPSTNPTRGATGTKPVGQGVTQADGGCTGAPGAPGCDRTS